MASELIFRSKYVYPDGAIREMVIWKVDSTSERPHGLKYRLNYCGPDGKVIRYDNERGKGDHKHIEGKQARYVFKDIESLVSDFLSDIRKERGED
jgi:hypothetical protein